MNSELISRFRHQKRDLGGRTAPAPPMPPTPVAFEDLGVGEPVVDKLILKHLLSAGSLRTDELARRLGIPLSLMEAPVSFLRREALLEGRGERNGGGIGALLHLNLTDQGRARAHEYAGENAYCGPIPVPLKQYVSQVLAQSVRRQTADRERARQVFNGLVVRDEVVEKIGAAFNSGGSLFLYGPPGTGKTFLAGQMVRLLSGDVAIPHAVEIQGQIVEVFDPATHQRTDDQSAAEALSPDSNDGGLIRDLNGRMDQRWVKCRRPVVVAGGELMPEMLDLVYQPNTGFYEAPLQMKANGGIFIIDDLGRQAVDPTLFLNRWIMPLENGIDYLSLHTGAKFRIPFDVLPVFATNIEPDSLLDEAFLRRLGYKVEIDYLTEEEFAKIFAQYCEANALPYDQEMVEYLVREHYRLNNRPMAACHPRDLINKAIDYCLYQGRPLELTAELLDKAWSSYFVTRS
ncbi:ATP-binding protein [Desulfurivibrio sp. C05AmB]|uniref:ATP-binding protein n=1 Tax=Desulfurivibrio sp. C05AmB TaxID=3374371 RepID=UPI00376EBCA3